MKKVAITGGIGSGKSVVASYIKELGYSVFSCDEIYHKIIESRDYIQKIESVFPDCVIGGKIDKKILSEIVFADEEKRKVLNGIAHPMIMDCLLAQMNKCTDAYVFAEVPLLFEGNFEELFDKIIVVTREKESRIVALLERDNSSRELIEEKFLAQFDYYSLEGRARLKKCGAIEIKNDQSIERLKLRINEVLENI